MQIVKEVPIAKIKTGARFQQPDSDEIEKLAESIERDGLLEPVGLNEDFTLIYGLTRIEASKLLGWETIPAIGSMEELEFLGEILPKQNLKPEKLNALIENTCNYLTAIAINKEGNHADC